MRSITSWAMNRSRNRKMCAGLYQKYFNIIHRVRLSILPPYDKSKVRRQAQMDTWTYKDSVVPDQPVYP